MNSLSIIGAFVITLALLSYGIGSISIQRFKLITPGVLIFLTLGVALDFIAVTLMIIGSSRGAFTPHGILGYTAMLTMVINMVLIYFWYFKHGFDSVISKAILEYSKIAYAWWLITYITGSLLVIWK